MSYGLSADAEGIVGHHRSLDDTLGRHCQRIYLTTQDIALDLVTDVLVKHLRLCINRVMFPRPELAGADFHFMEFGQGKTPGIDGERNDLESPLLEIQDTIRRIQSA